jgi:RNA polymerase sigma-70 factor, ECF subfamily
MTTTRLSLLECLGNPQNGEAWDDFFNIYSRILRSYLGDVASLRRLGSADIDEVVQEVYVKLIRTMATYQHNPARGRFRTFLYTVTMNALEDYCRRNKRHWAGKELPEDGQLAAPKNETVWIGNYERAIFSRVLEQMKAEQQSDLVPLRAFEEQFLKRRKGKDVAQELGISVDLVYQHASRIRTEITARCRALDGDGKHE